MQLDFAAREVTLKIVYYGPARSGKTTNLAALHAMAGAESRGRLMTLETQDDRTLFFDLLPLRFRARGSEVSLRLKVFTVPGQPMHAATRRLVLQDADGVAIIADSRRSEAQNNATSFFDLRRNLRSNGLDIARMPLVIQFNKRDLPDVQGDDELAALAQSGREPVFGAIATTGEGVLETFLAALHVTWTSLDREHDLASKLGVRHAELLDTAARELGAQAPVAALLGRCVGGSLDPFAREGR